MKKYAQLALAVLWGVLLTVVAETYQEVSNVTGGVPISYKLHMTYEALEVNDPWAVNLLWALVVVTGIVIWWR